MAQSNTKVFWQFYRTTTLVNLAFSTLFAIFAWKIIWLPILFATAGIGVAILFFNYYFSSQYYFYHNQGYTRKKLALNTLLVNLPIAAAILVLIVVT